ncbi:hypothetical protein QYF61_027890 [Mycteria americana]|uniref:Uncharacterized protein n=1 Tax=Mycteria americana TaxID=33587 RepID=A0AAN7MG32_MYCAM|nr:hypothetical protein QYF61_027890 [Mycteria americana]
MKKQQHPPGRQRGPRQLPGEAERGDGGLQPVRYLSEASGQGQVQTVARPPGEGRMKNIKPPLVSQRPDSALR